MPVELLTTGDLHIFKVQLLDEIKKLLQPELHSKKLLKTAEVCALMRISPGTLQNLRKNEVLKYSKVGGTLYYHYEDIQKLMNVRA